MVNAFDLCWMRMAVRTSWQLLPALARLKMIHRGLSDDNMPEGTCHQKPWLMTTTGEDEKKYCVF